MNNRVLTRHPVLLIVCLAVGAGGALAYSLSQDSVYEARSSLEFQDVNQQGGALVGATTATPELPAELAAKSAKRVTQPDILGDARKLAQAPESIPRIRQDVTTSVDTSSNLVDVKVEADSGGKAAALANAITKAAATRLNAEARAQYQLDARQLQRQITRIPNTPANLVTRQTNQANLSRLQALSIVARPAVVAETATVPGSPSSPKPVFNAALGGLLGLIIGFSAAFARESLDRKVRGLAEVPDLTGQPLLGEVSESVIGTAPFLVPEPETDESRAIANFGIMRRNVELMSESGPPKTIAITSAAPEEGKTTVSLSLACAFATVGRSTLLIEADLRRPVLSDRLGLPPADGLTQFLLGTGTEADVVQKVSLPARRATVNGHGHELALIAAGKVTADPDELLASARFREMLARASAAYDVVVLDTSPLLPVADTLEILPLVDACLVCVRTGRSKTREVRRLRELLARLPARPTGSVATGLGRRDHGADAYYSYYEAAKVG